MRLDGGHELAAPTMFLSAELLDALVERETRLRIDYRNIPEAPQETARHVLRGVTAFIEMLYFSAVLIEVARRQGAQTVEEAATRHDDIDKLVCALTNLQPAQVLEENPWIARYLSATPVPQELPELDAVVQRVTSLVGAFPVRELVDLATKVGLQEIGARCQIAHDGLSRFVERNDPLTDHRLRVVGPQYAAGQLSLQDVTHALALSSQDAVALLEDFGYSRPLEHFALTEEKRNTLYESMRIDRMQRQGAPHANPNNIARDVIATQRIENIDARPWIDPKLV